MKTILTAVVAVVGLVSCNKEVNENETISNSNSQTELASDKLLGGINVNKDTLFCNATVTVLTTNFPDAPSTPPLIDTTISENEPGFNNLHLVLERDGIDLIIKDDYFNGNGTSTNPTISKTFNMGVNTFNVENIGGDTNNGGTFWYANTFTEGDIAKVDVLTLEDFNLEDIEFDVPIGNDIILKIEFLGIDEGSMLKDEVNYYFYTRTL